MKVAQASQDDASFPAAVLARSSVSPSLLLLAAGGSSVLWVCVVLCEVIFCFEVGVVKEEGKVGG